MSRNGIMPATAPWVASANSSDREGAAFHGSMHPDRLHGVVGATGFKTATSRRPSQRGDHRRKHPLIDAQSENQNVLAPVHEVFNNPAFRNIVIKAVSTAPKSSPTKGLCATKTKSIGKSRSC
jgi:hypothetical protein